MLEYLREHIGWPLNPISQSAQALNDLRLDSAAACQPNSLRIRRNRAPPPGRAPYSHASSFAPQLTKFQISIAAMSHSYDCRRLASVPQQAAESPDQREAAWTHSVECDMAGCERHLQAAPIPAGRSPPRSREDRCLLGVAAGGSSAEYGYSPLRRVSRSR